MIQIDLNSATMIFEPEGSKPDTTASDDFVSTHLTQGFISPDIESRKNRPAFHIRGEVDVIADSQADLDDIARGRRVFNFIQIARFNKVETIWSGRTPNEGEVTFVVVPPVPFTANQRVALDSDSATTPFMTSSRAKATVSGKAGQKLKARVVARMGDHPNARLMLDPPQNTKTKAKNFLRRREDHRDFFTVFVTRDDKGAIQPLAHMHWRLEYNLQLTWARQKAKPVLLSPVLQFDQFVKGPPTDAAIKSVLDNPVPPFANDHIQDLQLKGLQSELHMQVTARRSLLVRNDFFT